MRRARFFAEDRLRFARQYYNFIFFAAHAAVFLYRLGCFHFYENFLAGSF